jgi:hypothetical protein
LSTAPVTRDCRLCAHYRRAEAIDPLAGWRVLSSKIFELRSKWEKHLAERAMWEQRRFEAALPFDFEPQAYPYCFHFTKAAGVGPSGKPVRYELCADNNPTDQCTSFKLAEAARHD